jgi:hypothetical protein
MKSSRGGGMFLLLVDFVAVVVVFVGGVMRWLLLFVDPWRIDCLVLSCIQGWDKSGGD